MQNGSAEWGGGRPECANYRALGAKKVSRLLRDNCLFPEHYEAGVTKTLLTGVVSKTLELFKTELDLNFTEFATTIDNQIKEDANSIILVHCTHGINR